MVRLIGRGREAFYYRAHVILVSNFLLPITTDSQITLYGKTHVVLMHPAPPTRFSFLHTIRFFHLSAFSSAHLSLFHAMFFALILRYRMVPWGGLHKIEAKINVAKLGRACFEQGNTMLKPGRSSSIIQLSPKNPFPFSSIPSSHILLLPHHASRIPFAIGFPKPPSASLVSSLHFLHSFFASVLSFLSVT